MHNSLVQEYFDFGQALEFLKDGEHVTNTSYEIGWKFVFTNGILYLVSPNTDEIESYSYEIDVISMEDILDETWFIVK